MIKMKELLNEGRYKDVVVGYISTADGIIKSELSQKTHAQLGTHRGICWRFAFENNTVYWHGDESEHNEVDEINVTTHLEDKYDVIVKRNVTLEPSNSDFERDGNNYAIAHGLMNEYRSNKTATHGCLMCYVCEEDSKKLNSFDKKLISSDIVYTEGDEFGFEKSKHCTILYGYLDDLTKEQITGLFSGINKFKIKLSKLSMFKNNGSKPFDVVKFDVSSDILNNLHKKAEKYPYESDFPDYKPHVTSCYVKSNSINIDKETDIEVTIDEIVYSPIEGEKIHLKLTDKKEKLDEGIRLDFLNMEIPRLEKEWDRLDSMGGREIDQQRISKLLQQYRLEKKNWDNVYKATMKESIYDGYDINLRNENKYVEVFINPSSKELRECIEHDQYALLLTNKDAYAWNRDMAYHAQIRAKDKIFRNAVSLLVWPEGNFNTVSMMVTDNTRDTTWHENPNTEKFIRNHPFFKGKIINDIIYWNGDIVGDWSDLSSKS